MGTFGAKLLESPSKRAPRQALGSGSSSGDPEDVTPAVVRQEALKMQHSQELCNRAVVLLALAVVATTAGWGPESLSIFANAFFLCILYVFSQIGAKAWCKYSPCVEPSTACCAAPCFSRQKTSLVHCHFLPSLVLFVSKVRKR